MLQAALWSKYPVSYVKNKIEPKLHEKGIQVKKYLSINQKECDLNDVDVVLCMNEMGGHSEIQRIRNLAETYNKKVMFISRKAAGWKSTIEQAKNMAYSKLIPDHEVENFCNEFIFLREKKLSYEEMIPHLAKYWPKDKLKTVSQLKKYAYRLVDRDSTPEYYKKYMQMQTQQSQDNRLNRFKVKSVEPEVSNAPSSPSKDEHHSAAAQSSSKEELEIELSLYKEEVSRLVNELKLKEERINLLEKKLSSSGNEKEKKIVRLIQVLKDSVEFGIVDKNQAWLKLVELTS